MNLKTLSYVEMAGILLQTTGLDFKGFLEPIISSSTFWIIFLLIVIWILVKLVKTDKRGKIIPGVLVYDTTTNTPLESVPSKPLFKIDYSITPADPRFYTLPWEYKEALYVNRINQLSSKCREMQKKLKAAGIK
ncbi:hypothetical protein [Rufibacter immobilis]|uniref:hypothetical protein n=1 Tax=Rufibacter immobilis TaxID=1348778 RepID=UPI0035EA7440